MASQPEVRTLTRNDLARFLKDANGRPDMRAIIAFENALAAIQRQGAILSVAPLVTTAVDSNLPASKVLTDSADIEVAEGASDVSFDLTDSGATAGSYGDASSVIQITIDAKGRVTGVQAFALNSDNVTEGTTNLYFTDARAQAAFSGSANIDINSGVISTIGDDAALASGPVVDLVVSGGVVKAVDQIVGFSGTGSYTNFTIDRGVITAAS